MFAHDNWVKAGIEGKVAALAARRSLKDLTVCPILTVTTQRFLDHVAALLKLKGARVAFGGKALEGHSVPSCYGAFDPTAVYVPLEEMLRTPENFKLCTTEIFGPFQVDKMDVEWFY